MSNNALFHNREHLARLANLQLQASSGLKYHRPSDAPLVTAEIGVMKRSALSLDSQLNQIGRATGQLNSSVTHLVEFNTLLTRARQIALEAPQSNGLSDRNALAAEVESILDRLVAIANATDGEQFLYSGAAISTRPVHINEDAQLAISHVSYQGSRQPVTIAVSNSIGVDTRYVGLDTFFDRERGETLFFGETGIRGGPGTDSEIGRANLIVRHTQTIYAAGSGVAAGIDSVNGDTIIGQSGTHTLTLVDTSGSGSSGTVSLNNGQSVAWTSSDNNLEVIGPKGERVFVDTTAIAAGFSGSIAITANGALSIDGGASVSPITFANDQIISNSITGGVTHLDTTKITRVGVELLEYRGTADAFTALLELRDDLLNNRGLGELELASAFERRLQDIERASDRVLEIVGLQSVDLQDLQQMEIHNENLQLELQSRVSSLESADMPSVIVEMQQMQSMMQFNFAAISIVQNNSILDFLG